MSIMDVLVNTHANLPFPDLAAGRRNFSRADLQRLIVNAIPESEFDRTAYIAVDGEDTLALDGAFTVANLKVIIAAMESA